MKRNNNDANYLKEKDCRRLHEIREILFLSEPFESIALLGKLLRTFPLAIELVHDEPRLGLHVPSLDLLDILAKLFVPLFQRCERRVALQIWRELYVKAKEITTALEMSKARCLLAYNTTISAACMFSQEEDALGLLIEMEKSNLSHAQLNYVLRVPSIPAHHATFVHLPPIHRCEFILCQPLQPSKDQDPIMLNGSEDRIVS
ncbi:hypothetical protein AKJ16_DCAP09925 [Drosera capensis]